MLSLAKILPALVLPAGIVILLLILSAVLRKRGLAIVALALLWLSSMSVVSDRLMRAAEGWAVPQRPAAAPRADAIVVLSGMLHSAAGPGAQDEWAESVDRFEAGLALFKAEKAPLLVFTGGWLPGHPDGSPEGKVLRERAIERGVPADRIVVSSFVRNTEEESRAVSELLRRRTGSSNAPSIVLVTSAFHMRRSELLFTRTGLFVTPFPVDFRTSAAPFSFMQVLPRGGSIENTETALRELYGYLYYRFIKTK